LGATVCVILIPTSFNIEKLHGKFCVNMFFLTFGQRPSNSQNYAMVCPNLTCLWHHSRTVLFEGWLCQIRGWTKVQ